MDKAIWKLTGESPYFLGNVLVEVRVVFLLDCLLVLSLLKHRGVWIFFDQKKWRSQIGEAPEIVV